MQSITAGQHRAIGDQVDRPLLRGTETPARKLQGFHEGLSIKIFFKYKVSASIVFPWDLRSLNRTFLLKK